MKNIIKSLTNQAKKQKRTRIETWRSSNPQPLELFKESPEDYLRATSTIHIKALNHLIKMSRNFNGNVYIRQGYLANLLGITRQYANVIIKQLEFQGFITTKYRHMRSCLYRVSSYFENPFIRSRLGHLLRALRANLLCLLTQHNIQGYKDLNYRDFHDQKIKKGTFMDPGKILSPLSAAIYSEKNPISPEIRKLTYLNLTKWGQIKLSAFPDEVIIKADSLFTSYNKPITNKFNFFFKACADACAELNVYPDWNLVKQLASAFNMPFEAKMTLEEDLKQEHDDNPYKEKEHSTPPMKVSMKQRAYIDKELSFKKADKKVQENKDHYGKDFEMFWSILNKS